MKEKNQNLSQSDERIDGIHPDIPCDQIDLDALDANIVIVVSGPSLPILGREEVRFG